VDAVNGLGGDGDGGVEAEGLSVPLMSLSMVLGTPTLGTPCSLRKRVTDCVSSPPRAMRASILLSLRTSWTFSMPPGIFFTLVREEWRMVPPFSWMPSVFSRVRG
jgi:hypothetical protein